MAWENLAADVADLFSPLNGALCSDEDLTPWGNTPVRRGKNIRLSVWTTRKVKDTEGGTYKDPTQRKTEAAHRLRTHWRKKASRVDYAARYQMRCAADPEYRARETEKERARYGKTARPPQKSEEQKKQAARERARLSYARLGAASKAPPVRTPEGIERRKQQDRERKRARKESVCSGA